VPIICGAQRFSGQLNGRKSWLHLADTQGFNLAGKKGFIWPMACLTIGRYGAALYRRLAEDALSARTCGHSCRPHSRTAPMRKNDACLQVGKRRRYRYYTFDEQQRLPRPSGYYRFVSRWKARDIG